MTVGSFDRGQTHALYANQLAPLYRHRDQQSRLVIVLRVRNSAMPLESHL